MEVTHIYDLKEKGKVFSGKTRWEDEVYHQPGDVLFCGSKKWKVTSVSQIRQGCFSIPTTRHHCIGLSPIDHDTYPQIGDVLV